MKIPKEISTLSTYDLLLQSPSLIVKNNNKEYILDNIQTLYLYPLSIFDYISNLNTQDIIKITFLSLDKTIDYKYLFINKFKKVKNVEFIIDESYLDKIDLLKEVIDILYINNIKISLTINNLLDIKDSLIDCYSKISFFKIYMLNIINNSSESEYYKYLSNISNNNDALILIKTYLNFNEYLYYEDVIKKLKKLSIDVFQVSKKLISLNENNINIDSSIENYIRSLEKKYNIFKTKFISVKDLSTLYYPRFELDKHNNRKCLACLMKPYIDGKYLIPCKVNKMINNKFKYGILLNNLDYYEEKFKNYGKDCSDCASIFENDSLGNISEMLNNDNIKMELL